MKTIKQIDSEFVKWGKKYMKTNFVKSGKIKAGRGKTTSASFTKKLYICPQCGATAKKVNWKEYKQIKKKYNLYG